VGIVFLRPPGHSFPGMQAQKNRNTSGLRFCPPVGGFKLLGTKGSKYSRQKSTNNEKSLPNNGLHRKSKVERHFASLHTSPLLASGEPSR
jgi:hypothetical protein